MKRIPELDSVRGIAALGVLAYHLRPNDYQFGHMSLGAAAVNLFMILSGFLITSIILEHHRERSFLRTFYLRRGLRTWPIYYLTLLVFVVIDPFLPHPFGWRNVPYYLVYLQNWLLAQPFAVPFNPALDHTWSLAVEEQFYLLWPPLVCLAGARGLIPLALATIAASVVAREWEWHPWLLVTRFDGFALGALLAPVVREGALTSRQRTACRVAFGAVIPVGCGLAVPYWGLLLNVDVLATNALLFALVGAVLCFEGHPLLGPLRARPLRYVGTISYGLYLYHYVVNWFAGGFAVKYDQPWRTDLVKIMITVTLAVLSWELLERPLLGLKQRIRYGPGR
ncbi:MAG: acyltransferase [Planctomycetia bacterium]|nr:acyltransferase [Planctomycetia bacterium]